MTLDTARELLAIQADIGRNGNRYHCNGTKNILGAVSSEHGEAAVEQIIEEFHLGELFDSKSGMSFIREYLPAIPH